MKPTPKGWPRLAIAIFYKDANQAIDWLCHAFGFEVRLKVDGAGGVVEHSELTYGEAVLMIGDERWQKDHGRPWLSPRSVNGVNTQNVMIYVDDVRAHAERARAAGAKIKMEPAITDYGEGFWADRTYQCIDPEGHAWFFAERVRG